MRKKGFVFLVCVMVIGAGALGAFAQQKAKAGHVGGQIFKKDAKTVIPNATITVKHVKTGVSARDVTDKKGRFLLKDVAPGEYEVEALIDGVNYTYPPTIKVQSDAVTKLCFYTDPEKQLLKLLEGKCQTKPIGFWQQNKWYIVGAAAVAGGATAVVIATQKKEASPTKP